MPSIGPSLRGPLTCRSEHHHVHIGPRVNRCMAALVVRAADTVRSAVAGDHLGPRPYILKRDGAPAFLTPGANYVLIGPRIHPLCSIQAAIPTRYRPDSEAWNWGQRPQAPPVLTQGAAPGRRKRQNRGWGPPLSVLGDLALLRREIAHARATTGILAARLQPITTQRRDFPIRSALGACSLRPGASKPDAFAATVLSKKGQPGVFKGSTHICQRTGIRLPPSPLEIRHRLNRDLRRQS